MKFLIIIAAVCCFVGVIATEDSLAMESEVNIQKVKRHQSEAETEYHLRPGKKYVRGKYEKGRRPLVHREREAREQEESWVPYHKPDVRGPVYELPQDFDIDGKYFDEPKHRYQPTEEPIRNHVPYVAPTKNLPTKEEGENLRVESSQYQRPKSGSYLNHIKEQMNEGKLLGYSSFVEHFSENDDAEELKTAMREGSLEDIKKLVPKSVVTFQMYHGGEEQKVYKTEPLAERKPEVAWKELNEWHQPTPTPWSPPQTNYLKSVPHKPFVIPERKRRMRKHPESHRYRPTYHYQTEESREEVQTTTSPEPDPPKITSNEVYEKDTYPEIIPSISFEIPSHTFNGESDYETASSEVSREQDRQESRASYHRYAYNNDQSAWMPVGEKPAETQSASEQHKVISTAKPPETSKLYYEHFKNSKETTKYSQLPKIGQVVVEGSKQSHIPETYYLKKPVRVKPTAFTKRPTSPPLPSGEDFNQRYAQIPTATPTRTVTPQPTRHWSKPDTTAYQNQKRVSTPTKLEKILNKQTEIPADKSGKDGNGNIFLTKEFQSEISDFFNGGKSDLEWIPSTQVRYDARASSPVSYHASSDHTETPKPKKYRIYRSERNPGVPGPKNVVFLGPENQAPSANPGSFSVSASYQIDKNRRNGE